MAKDAAGDRLPWFRFWPRDFMADPEVLALFRALGFDGIGRYLMAIFSSWENHTPGIATRETWCRWMGDEDMPDSVWKHYKHLFVELPDGQFAQKRLQAELAEAVGRSLHGKKAVAAREAKKNPGSSRDVPEVIHAVAVAVAEVKEPKVKTICPESSPTPRGPLSLPAIGGKFWTPNENQVSSFREAYPGVSLESEFPRMRSWLESNTKNGKTLKGLSRFANSWLSRQQDRPAPALNGTGGSDGW